MSVWIKMTRRPIPQSVYDWVQGIILSRGGAQVEDYRWVCDDNSVVEELFNNFPDFRRWKFGYIDDNGTLQNCVWEGESGQPLPPINYERVNSPNVKFYPISNDKYEKQVETCAYCGATIITIVRKGASKLSTQPVPNDPERRRICKRCADTTQLTVGGYGFTSRPSRFTTPMDACNTVILGLEQEFEGYFYGWLELQRAHMGKLHYGYDSSIALDPVTETTSQRDPNNGKNELSWDCGSYSWWKYASPLKTVCEVVKKYGGHVGASAGVHIHASFNGLRGEQIESIARRSFELLQSREDIKNLMLIVSGRSRERLDRWAYMDMTHPDSRETAENGGVRKAKYTDHHSCISYNRAGTVEFRCFSASLDHREILKRMKFVKEYVTLIRNKCRPDDFIKSFSAGTKKFIAECQEAQLQAGNVTREQFVL